MPPQHQPLETQACASVHHIRRRSAVDRSCSKIVHQVHMVTSGGEPKPTRWIKARTPASWAGKWLIGTPSTGCPAQVQYVQFRPFPLFDESTATSTPRQCAAPTRARIAAPAVPTAGSRAWGALGSVPGRERHLWSRDLPARPVFTLDPGSSVRAYPRGPDRHATTVPTQAKESLVTKREGVRTGTTRWRPQSRARDERSRTRRT
jgi:hypothetical protein